MRFCQLLKTGLSIALLAAAAFAQPFAPISTPTAAYTGATTLIPITPVNGTVLSSITDGTQTITLSTPFSAQTVPAGGWATWGSPPNTESATPRVIANFTPLTTVTLTLSVPSNTFGFEVEPDTFGVFTISANFMAGATSIGVVTRDVNGNAGALLAAGSSIFKVTSVVITIPAGANGFAMAQFRYSNAVIGISIPTVGGPGLCALGMALLAAGALLARRQNATV